MIVRTRVPLRFCERRNCALRNCLQFPTLLCERVTQCARLLDLPQKEKHNMYRSMVTKFAAAAALAGLVAVGTCGPTFAADADYAGDVLAHAYGADGPYDGSGYVRPQGELGRYGEGAYAYAPGSAYAPNRTYAPGYAYAPGRDVELGVDMDGNPIYQSQTSPSCTFGDKLYNNC
jgi:hypothetical protein